MASSLLKNPIVEIVLALVVILVVATLSFASAISGAITDSRRTTLLGSGTVYVKVCPCIC